MNSQEFEAAIQGRIVCPKSAIQYSAILFQTEYPPEEMVKKMNAPGNATQYMDKMKNGAGIWKYFCNTMTGGYIFCIVNDNPPTTGVKGDNMGIREYFDAHTDQRMLLKYAIIFGASLAVVYLTFALQNNLVSMEYVALVPVAIAWLNEKVKPLDPNKPWAIIGAAPKKKR